MTGTWTGTYQHESERIPEERRNQRTKFKINIIDFDGVHFSGEIEDEVESGGMQGVGRIEGKLIDNKISFIKMMPIQTVYMPDGTRTQLQNRHRNIYYSGIVSGDSIKGVWKLKFGVRLINNKIAIFYPIKGNWEMRRKD
ncbi:MAG: hypothetical protein WAT43_13340 [Chitinophagales bacterium]